MDKGSGLLHVDLGVSTIADNVARRLSLDSTESLSQVDTVTAMEDDSNFTVAGSLGRTRRDQ